MVQLIKTLAIAVLAGTSLAHPGHDINEELESRLAHLAHPERRTLAHCKRDLEENGHYQMLMEARMEKANKLRAERGFKPMARSFLRPRDLHATLAERDLLNDRDIFAERAACVLDPEVTEGPYWVAGELVRSNVLEGTKGVQVHLDINVIDTSQCKPVTNAYAELWGCNSTGVYTGVVAKGNGAGPAVPSEINNSALRGVQPTNATGTASFLTVVPGHYVGRTNHLHTIIHHGATLLPNNTISGGTISHVGQFYFDQSLLQSVEKTSPYSTNNQAWTQNAQDQLFQTGKQGGDDPVVKVVLLGNKVEDGLYGWIDVGVNPTAKRVPSPVNYWTSKGGVANPVSPWKGYPWTRKAKKSEEEAAVLEE